mmetsp:Transcript_16280/g.18781  ORF Transcript_16280/g.18781 Transcript_16280/m.18781 type:complete len:410 (+) Transcript_16280:246-1475(+)|eukprot:CAMPEP_0194132244 /NCGR_PEP_ID=MMETSP0152-20130528/2756_1 /TAXON_ID=1049557 /ORGANISM="Thalassiothrix antarctica, Strain L6-D1" /LENGTH=409 /DNA_ID=CAMNT_0038827223 /DNA_START=225 /DNA_END=1454 /DNA_ORIENTATION=+
MSSSSLSYQVGTAFGVITSALAFTPPISLTKRLNSQLNVVTDPTVITRKEYADICGDVFAEDEMLRRLEKHEYLYPKHVEVIQDLEPIAAEMTDEILLETGDKSWQPQDYLPEMADGDWMEQVQELRKAAAGVPDEVLVVLVGDMVTEEALPTYQTLLNTFEGCTDPTGAIDTAWAKWSRGWTSEENRHGDLLNKYLYLGGRCNMRSIEVTIQHLITNGFNPDARKDPYRGFVYTSFQERATKISHGNVARLARKYGDTHLGKICSKIGGDEGRHERAYQLFCQEILDRDPNGLLLVFGDMMRGQITMPAEMMTDGNDQHLYDNFSEVAQRTGVYTAIDYADILDHLIKRWDLENIEGLNSEGEKERDYLCKLPRRYRKLAERSMNKKRKACEDTPTLKAFGWIQGRMA